MKKMETPTRKLLLITIALLLSACNLAGEKREVTPTNILAFFEIESAALSDEYVYEGEIRVQDLFSSVWGTVFLSDGSASFQNIAEIVPGCRPTSLDQPQMSALRFIDVGDLTIARGSDGVVIDKSESSFNFFNFIHLEPGSYQNRISGLKNSLKYEQDFLLPGSPEMIEVTSGPSFVKQILPSPRIDEASVIHVQKELGLQFDFSGDTDAEWVRVVLQDLEGASLTCYGRPNESFEVPAEALADFATTDNGSLWVDFLSINMRQDVPRIKESYVRSFTRHRHGVQIFRNGNNNVAFSFGTVRFE